MHALYAIALQTIRTSLRQKVFLAELLVVLLVVTAVPYTAMGDGTAVGLVQLILTYTMGLLVTACSAATLWIACVSMSREIEGYQMHLVTSAPTPRWRVWLGKWAGVFVLQALLLAAGGAIGYGMLHWRLAHENFPKPERDRLNAEVLVARREYRPPQTDFWRLADEEYARRRDRGELSAGHDPESIRYELCRQIKARSSELPADGMRGWTITGIARPAADAPAIFLRYRYYVGDPVMKKQSVVNGAWFFRAPDSRSVVAPQRSSSASFHEMALPPALIQPDGKLEFAFRNLSEDGASVIFQAGDGPSLLVPATSFASNYVRTLLLVLFQLAFLAALGCTVSSIFSTPVAIFMAAGYLAAGLLIQPSINARYRAEDGSYAYTGQMDRAAHLMAAGAKVAVVSLGDFDAASGLANGRLITNRRLVVSFGILVGLRALPMALFGIWIFTRRELGLVVREQ